VIVNPRSGEGWLDDEVMTPARSELVRHLRELDRDGRFRIYCPVTKGGQDIYVHSKITIADNRQLRVGSANLNNRSMGLDSECDLLIDCALEANRGYGKAISVLLGELLSEHLGASIDTIEAKLAETGSLIATIDSFASGEGRTLVPLTIERPSAAERALAHSEALDPESAGETYEPIARPGLLSGLWTRAWSAGA
jgi:phosphatidylserine/phosphatidylglycerophosphate/cardiolipin synthase-like enzyme